MLQYNHETSEIARPSEVLHSIRAFMSALRSIELHGESVVVFIMMFVMCLCLHVMCIWFCDYLGKSDKSESYSMVVLYSRDHGVLDFLALHNHPKRQPQFSFKTAWRYWLSVTKPKNAFRATQNLTSFYTCRI